MKLKPERNQLFTAWVEWARTALNQSGDGAENQLGSDGGHVGLGIAQYSYGEKTHVGGEDTDKV